MSTKCKCNHCSTNLEFESLNAGKTVTSPACGLETILYIPQTTSFAPTPPRTSQKIHSRATSPFADQLSNIRSASCYKTLRAVIDVAFNVSKILVGLAAVVSVIGVIVTAYASDVSNTKLEIVTAILTLGGALLVVLLLHAAHQAALLLVDIADCSIRLAAAAESRKPD